MIAPGIASPAADVKHAHVENHRQQEDSERALRGDNEVGRERTAAEFSDRGEKHLTAVQDWQWQEVENREVNVDQNRENQGDPDSGFGRAMEDPDDPHGSGNLREADIRVRMDEAHNRLKRFDHMI